MPISSIYHSTWHIAFSLLGNIFLQDIDGRHRSPKRYLPREVRLRAPPDAGEERPVAMSPTSRPSRVKIETITPRQVRRRGRARGREKMFQGLRAMATLYHNCRSDEAENGRGDVDKRLDVRAEVGLAWAEGDERDGVARVAALFHGLYVAVVCRH